MDLFNLHYNRIESLSLTHHWYEFKGNCRCDHGSMFHDFRLDHVCMLQSLVPRQTQKIYAVTDIPKAIPLCTSLQQSFICPVQPWYLPLCLTGLDFLSLQLLVHHLVDGRLRLFGMLFVMLVLSWPEERTGSAIAITKRCLSTSNQPPSCGASTHSSPPTPAHISACLNRPRNWC